MKHSLRLICFLVLLTPAARAQSANPAIWCPAGCRWTYGYGDMSTVGTLSVWYAGDTLVGGQPAQVLRRSITAASVFPGGVPLPGTTSTYGLPLVITRVVADRVEVRANGQFYTLYDFAAVPGSSWLTAPVIPGGPCPQGLVQVTVDSVGRQQVGGRSLRWFRAHLTAAAGTTIAGSWGGRMYEQLGNVTYMQPQSPTCGGTDPGYLGPLVSFRATGLPSIGYNSTTGTLLANAEARATAAGFTAFPNPSAGLLTLELPTSLSANASLRLLDLTGRVLRQMPALAGHQLDVRGLPAGAYILLLAEPGQPPLARRVELE